MAIISFDPAQTDVSELRAQLATQVSGYDSWTGVYPTQTGNLLLDFIASIGAFELAKLLRISQDFYSDTAMSDRALYALAIKQGARIPRKKPASATVTVTVPNTVSNTVTLEPYTQLQGANTYWFVRDYYNLTPGTHTIQVYQGYVMVAQNNGLNTNWQAFISNETGFDVSNDDVAVSIDGSYVPVVTNLLSNYKNSSGVMDVTLGNGGLLLMFGTSEYGTKPTLSNVVTIKYAVTSGSAANNLAVLGQTVTVSDSTQDMALSTFVLSSAASGGEDQPPASQYKYLGSLAFGTAESALTKQQIVATALDYPGVVDVRMQAQREIDPNNKDYMNVVNVYLLTQNAWGPSDALAYKQYLNEKCVYPAHFVLKTVEEVPVNVTATIYCHSWADLDTAKSNATDAVNFIFARSRGIIGKDVTLNDLHTTIKASYEGIDTVTLVLPTEDQVVSAIPQVSPTLTSTGTGSISGSFSYAIAIQMANGVIAPANWGSILVDGVGSITLQWPDYGNAVGYLVYGRQGVSGFGLLATVDGNTLEWTDDLSVVPGAEPVMVNTVPISMLTLSSLNLTTAYTTRS